MTKRDIIRAAAKGAGVTQDTAAAVLDAAQAAIMAALADGDPVKINGFGSFEVKQRKAREVYDFTAQNKKQAPAYNALTFTPGRGVKRLINENRG